MRPGLVIFTNVDSHVKNRIILGSLSFSVVFRDIQSVIMESNPYILECIDSDNANADFSFNFSC